ncbi:MAG: hypothetical protein K8953_09620 [Proteobacteria bacterium]|nr:hypothetical protein [Pseudomonadota bacterium]
MTQYNGGREANVLRDALVRIIETESILAKEFFSDRTTGPGLERWEARFRATLIVNDNPETHNKVIQIREACRTIMLELFENPDVKVWLDKPPGADGVTMLHVDLSSRRDRVGYWWNMIMRGIRALLG